MGAYTAVSALLDLRDGEWRVRAERSTSDALHRLDRTYGPRACALLQIITRCTQLNPHNSIHSY